GAGGTRSCRRRLHDGRQPGRFRYDARPRTTLRLRLQVARRRGRRPPPRAGIPVSDDLKRQAAIAALAEIRDGMIVGLGSGSTASIFIRELGKAGLKVAGIPTSEESRRIAEEVGVPLTTFKDHPQIDVTVDGADEVSPQLDLIKGLGGALVREKIVAHASSRLVIIVDESKLVDRLGSKTVIPVEVIPLA